MTDYKFSKQIKMFSIILIIIGAIGIAFGFYSAPSNVEEAKEIVANMSHDDHGGGHGGGHAGRRSSRRAGPRASRQVPRQVPRRRSRRASTRACS